MGWQQLNYGVWFTNLSPLAPNWWIGWSSVGGFRLFRSDRGSALESTASSVRSLAIRRQDSEGWVDFFVGQADVESRQRCSIVDVRRRLALHYLKTDLPHLHRADCPCQEIPQHLWRKLLARASEWS